MTRNRRAVVVTSLIATILFALPSRGRTEDTEASGRVPADYDCGFLAIDIMLRIEGRAAELSQLEAVLPKPSPRGYSMEELRRAARHFGLRLRGVLLPLGDRAPDRPALVFINQKPHGHYIVIRPVGHSGKLLQVIDPNRPPEVMDAAVQYSSPEWTGIALIPDRPNSASRFLVLLAVAAALLLALRSLRKLFISS